MTGHDLTQPATRLATPYGAVFHQTCSCGVRCWGTTLPQVWERHTLHLSKVRQANPYRGYTS